MVCKMYAWWDKYFVYCYNIIIIIVHYNNLKIDKSGSIDQSCLFIQTNPVTEKL